MRASLVCLLTLAAVLLAAPAQAFCGFYVGKTDQPLFNKASKVAIVRDGDRTVLTLSADYEGDLKDFAMVVPVPVLLHKEQIHIGDRSLLEKLDAYSVPRLVEYYDSDPCRRWEALRGRAPAAAPMRKAVSEDAPSRQRTAALGVTVEAQYAVGEYEIVILSAKQSDGLATWLTEAGYKIPPAASRALAPYIRQDMKFFVAKVNLEKQKRTGSTFLRPIQIAYQSEKFMLPIRLGMANAKGPQDLLVFALTRQGRVESTNYRTVKMPTGVNIPTYLKGQFQPFYQATFAHQAAKEHHRAVFTEYFWNMGSCDPCSADPLSPAALKELGVFWLDDASGGYHGYGVPVVLTRLHVRYDDEHFPEDLAFQITRDSSLYQARYVMQQPFKGDLSCAAGRAYQEQLVKRHREEAKTLAALTGWSLAKIKKQMGPDFVPETPWYQKLWK